MDLFKLALADVEETLLCNSLPEFHAEQATGQVTSVLVRVDYRSEGRQKKFLEFPAVLRCTAYTQ